MRGVYGVLAVPGEGKDVCCQSDLGREFGLLVDFVCLTVTEKQLSRRRDFAMICKCTSARPTTESPSFRPLCEQHSISQMPFTNHGRAPTPEIASCG